MENILRNLKDPSWWFTVVIVGLLIAIFGAPLRLILFKLLSLLSSQMRQKWERYKQKVERKVDWILSDSRILMLHSVMTLVYLIAFTVSFLTVVSFAILISLKTYMKIQISLTEGIWLLVMILMFLIMVILSGFSSHRNITLCMKAYDRYRKKEKQLKLTSETPQNSQSDNKTS
jgi:amino acid transporter